MCLAGWQVALYRRRLFFTTFVMVIFLCAYARLQLRSSSAKKCIFIHFGLSQHCVFGYIGILIPMDLIQITFIVFYILLNVGLSSQILDFFLQWFAMYMV